MIQFYFAFLAGVLTIFAPCILPVLPILLAGSIGKKNRLRPLFIVLGFIIFFVLLTLLFSVFSKLLGLSPTRLRQIAAILLVIFGIVLIYPKPFEWMMAKLAPLFNRVHKKVGEINQESNWGGFGLGALLGILWTPCAGPILASILTLIATSSDLTMGAWLLFFYALGSALPMLLIAYGSQYFTTKIKRFAKYTGVIQKVFGILLVLLGIAMYFQYDVLIVSKLLEYFPGGQGIL